MKIRGGPAAVTGDSKSKPARAGATAGNNPAGRRMEKAIREPEDLAQTMTKRAKL